GLAAGGTLSGGTGVGGGRAGFQRGEVCQGDGVLAQSGRPAGADEQPRGAGESDVTALREGAVPVAYGPGHRAFRGAGRGSAVAAAAGGRGPALVQPRRECAGRAGRDKQASATHSDRLIAREDGRVKEGTTMVGISEKSRNVSPPEETPLLGGGPDLAGCPE